MSNIDLALFLLSNILSFLIGSYLYTKEGYSMGYNRAAKDITGLFTISITRAFPDNKQETLDKIEVELKSLMNEVTIKANEQVNAQK